MSRSFLYSLLLHVGVITLLLIGLPSFTRDRAEMTPVPLYIDLKDVQITAKTNIPSAKAEPKKEKKETPPKKVEAKPKPQPQVTAKPVEKKEPAPQVLPEPTPVKEAVSVTEKKPEKPAPKPVEKKKEPVAQKPDYVYRKTT